MSEPTQQPVLRALRCDHVIWTRCRLTLPGPRRQDRTQAGHDLNTDPGWTQGAFSTGGRPGRQSRAAVGQLINCLFLLGRGILVILILLPLGPRHRDLGPQKSK